MEKKIIISLEGNIAVGKSSFLSFLKEKLHDDAEFIYEPVDEWTSIKDKDGKNLLQIFYEDKTRWGYTFQNVAYITRMNNLLEAIHNSNKKYIIIDRSLQADLNTFAKMLYNDGCISELEWNAYNKWNTFFDRNYGKLIQQHIIYLRCQPEIAHSRTKIRNRDSEEGIPLDYLKSLHHYHDMWLLENENTLILDANEDFVGNKQRFNEMYSQVEDYISSF